ncbi:MAG TPA: hypothetical protein DCL76_01530 [Chloroflexi bacterium]|nr:hypothetical protein [Chloroflexota bacterium]
MRKRRDSILNLFTSALIYATMMVGGIYLYIFVEPQSMINPFPPPRIPARAVLATETPLPTPTFVPTVAPTSTLMVPTPIVVPAEPTDEPTATIVVESVALYDYILQEGSIGYTTQFAYPELKCDWLGIAGTVFDEKGNAAEDLIVNVEGPDGFTMDALIGTKPEFGPAGYEITLANSPINSDMLYEVRLLDTFGNSVSDSYPITTFDDCDRNLIIANFIWKK